LVSVEVTHIIFFSSDIDTPRVPFVHRLRGQPKVGGVLVNELPLHLVHHSKTVDSKPLRALKKQKTPKLKNLTKMLF
jgi:hypothetical protein